MMTFLLFRRPYKKANITNDLLEVLFTFQGVKKLENQAKINGKVEKSTRPVNCNRTFDDDIFGSSGSLFHFPWPLQEGQYHQRTSRSLAYLSIGQKKLEKNQAEINGKVEKSTCPVNCNRTFDDDLFDSFGGLLLFLWLLQEGQYYQ